MPNSKRPRKPRDTLHPDEAPEETFFAAVGAAVSMWQAVEREMAHVFPQLLACKAGFAGSAILYHIKNNKTRLEILNIAAKFSLGFDLKYEKLFSEWQALSSRLSDATELRNKIAHFEVDEEMGIENWIWTLRPPRDGYSRFQPDKPERSRARALSKAIGFKRIESASAEFVRLSNDLNAFARKLFTRRHPSIARAIRKQLSEPIVSGAKQTGRTSGDDPASARRLVPRDEDST